MIAQAAGIGLLALASFATTEPVRPSPCAASSPPSASAAPDLIPRQWLGAELSVAEAERDNPGISDERAKRDPDLAKPFGGRHGAWEALKARMAPGDALRTFASSPESWQHHAGRAGIALVRDGKVVHVLVTVMN